MTAPAPVFSASEAQNPTMLVFNEKRRTAAADLEVIKDAQGGHAAFMVKQEPITLSGRRTLVDASTGIAVGQMRNRRVPGRWDEYYVSSMTNERKCNVRRGSRGKCDSADIFVGDEKVGEAIGSWREKSFGIVIENRMAAKFSLQCGSSQGSGEISPNDDAEPSFCVEVQAGHDVSFVALLTLVLRDLFSS